MTRTTAAVGVDPGGKWCGIVSRIGDEVIDQHVVTRADDEHVTDFALRCSRRVRSTAGRLRRECARRSLPPVVLIAHEDVVAPRWHSKGKAKPINPVPIIHTGVVLGSCRAAVLDAMNVIVRPNSHGEAPLGSYPDELVSPAERRIDGWKLRKGTGKLRHARSAWDVAGTALMPLHMPRNADTGTESPETGHEGDTGPYEAGDDPTP